jgi:hypothetical protein
MLSLVYFMVVIVNKVLQANLPHSFQECLCKIDGNKDIFLLPIDSQFTITTIK